MRGVLSGYDTLSYINGRTQAENITNSIIYSSSV